MGRFEEGIWKGCFGKDVLERMFWKGCSAKDVLQRIFWKKFIAYGALIVDHGGSSKISFVFPSCSGGAFGVQYLGYGLVVLHTSIAGLFLTVL